MPSVTVNLPYGRKQISAMFPRERLAGILETKRSEEKDPHQQVSMIREALRSPIGTSPLCDLARGKEKVVIISSDHTRPVPSRMIMPELLREVRRGNPNAQITILVATGCHRKSRESELLEKYGAEILKRERIVQHDCDEQKELCDIGTLPSGGRCQINRLVCEADLVIAEGFIEPHFFAGFSGGRKAILPGIASRQTVMANHCAEFIDDPCARTGILSHNPIHLDMQWAARRAGLAFILNVVLGPRHDVVYAVAGDPVEAHEKGCDYLRDHCMCEAVQADIVVTTNGGYPLDQNIYQAVKGMTAAESCVKQNGVIIMLAECSDGHGGARFYQDLASSEDTRASLCQIRTRARDQTLPDQWQAQIFLRVLQRATVIFVSEVEDSLIRKLHMVPAHSVTEALEAADQILNRKGSIAVIPDGVSVFFSSNRHNEEDGE